MKYLALLTTLLVVLTIASAIPAAARVDQAAQNAAAEAQNDEQTIVQAARQAAGEAASANRAKAENKSGKRHKPKERTEQTVPDKGMPETGGFVTASNMVLLGLGTTTAIVVGGVLFRRVLTRLL